MYQLLCPQSFEWVPKLITGSKQPGEDNKAAWAKIRKALRVSQGWIKPTTDKSISNRHGEMAALSGNERVFLMARSSTLVYRLVRLRSFNPTQLPDSDFPLLDAGSEPTHQHPVEGYTADAQKDGGHRRRTLFNQLAGVADLLRRQFWFRPNFTPRWRNSLVGRACVESRRSHRGGDCGRATGNPEANLWTIVGANRTLRKPVRLRPTASCTPRARLSWRWAPQKSEAPAGNC